MTSKELALKTAAILDDHKANDIKILEVRDITSVADYFVLCTGNSNTHIKSLSGEVEYELEQLGVRPSHNEGVSTATWILKDYGSVVVHIFGKEADEFYRLEHLWADAVKVDFEATEN